MSENKRVYGLVKKEWPDNIIDNKIYFEDKPQGLRMRLTNKVRWSETRGLTKHQIDTMYQQRLNDYDVIEFELVPVKKISAYKFRVKKEFDKWKKKIAKIKYILDS